MYVRMPQQEKSPKQLFNLHSKAGLVRGLGAGQRPHRHPWSGASLGIIGDRRAWQCCFGLLNMDSHSTFLNSKTKTSNPQARKLSACLGPQYPLLVSVYMYMLVCVYLSHYQQQKH